MLSIKTRPSNFDLSKLFSEYAQSKAHPDLLIWTWSWKKWYRYQNFMFKKLRKMSYPIENLQIIWSIHTFFRIKPLESKIKVSILSDSIRQSSLVVPEIFFFVKQTSQSNSKFVVRKIRASLYEQGSDWNYQGIIIQVISSYQRNN